MFFNVMKAKDIVDIENEKFTHNKNPCISSGGCASLWGSGTGA